MGWIVGYILMMLVYSAGLLMKPHMSKEANPEGVGFSLGLACFPLAIGLSIWHGWRKRRS